MNLVSARLCVVYSLFLALISGCAHDPVSLSPPAQSKQVQVQSLRERFDLPKQVQTLSIVNPYGEINVRSMPDGAIGTVTAAQHFGAEGIPEITLTVDQQRAVLRVSYANGLPTYTEFAGNPGRADLAVYVPNLSQLDLLTSNARIQVKRYQGNVRARSQSGSLLVSGSGVLDLQTESGDIQAMQISGLWKGQSRVVSESGLVQLLLPETGDFSVTAQSSKVLDVHLSEKFQVDAHTADTWVGRMGKASAVMEVRGSEIYLGKLVLPPN